MTGQFSGVTVTPSLGGDTFLLVVADFADLAESDVLCSFLLAEPLEIA